MSAEGWINIAAQRKCGEVGVLLGLTRGRLGSMGPCPACNESKRGGGDARAPLGMESHEKGWKCHRCSAVGDGVDLVSYRLFGRRVRDLVGDETSKLRDECIRLGMVSASDAAEKHRSPKGVAVQSVSALVQPGRRRPLSQPSAQPQAEQQPEEADDHLGSTSVESEAEACRAALWRPEGAPVLRYLLESRRFTEETIRKWRLGAHVRRDGDKITECWLSIPLTDQREQIVNIRYRSIPGVPGGDIVIYDKVCKYKVIPKKPLPLFGSHALASDLASLVIIVEGELDVISAWQVGYEAGVVSGTAGADTFSNRDDWLDQLEPYAGFVLAFDADEAGDRGAAALAEKLGKDRCSRARMPEGNKDLGDCLKNGVDPSVIEAALDNAQPMMGVELRRVVDYSDDIEALIKNPASLIGTPTGSAKLDGAIGGIRPGLVVVTGETGHGKTTFLTWLLLEQARHGVPVCLTSFEQRPIGTVQKLLRAQVGNDFTKVTEEQRRKAMAELGELPITIVDHRGHLAPEKVLDVIKYLVRRKGVKRILIDHLGFVVSPEAEDERRAIDDVVRALSMLSEQQEITIFLVCHPSNRDRAAFGRPLKIDDIKGSSAIRQDCHEGWVVDKRRPTAPFPCSVEIRIDKSRSEFANVNAGVILAYDPFACVYTDLWIDTPCARRGVTPVVPQEKRRANSESGEGGHVDRKRPKKKKDDQPDVEEQ